MNYISFDCKKTDTVIHIPTENCKGRVIRKMFGKSPTIFYYETTGRHKSGNIYTKLETVKSGTEKE
jgi:hypothetical protein